MVRLHSSLCIHLKGASALSETADSRKHWLIQKHEGDNTENRPASRSILGVCVFAGSADKVLQLFISHTLKGQ